MEEGGEAGVETHASAVHATQLNKFPSYTTIARHFQMKMKKWMTEEEERRERTSTAPKYLSK